jgi:hypothetical protein
MLTCPPFLDKLDEGIFCLIRVVWGTNDNMKIRLRRVCVLLSLAVPFWHFLSTWQRAYPAENAGMTGG